jgi:MoaA/NifB/PqqE/SkfB family radical SAM enzyme
MTKLSPQPTPSHNDAPPLPKIDPITHLPILILYPHSRCNCRCLMCDIWRATTSSEVQVADVARWLDEWRGLGVRRVVLSGGEALMHSQLLELCALLRDAGIGITILSTGLLLRRHAAALVRYCDDLVLSLDGPRELHNRIRNIPRAYEKLAEGVQAVREAGGGGTLTMSGRCTVQRANFRQLRATLRAAQELGLDRISFLAADVSSEAFNRPGGWEAERVEQVALEAADLPALAQELEALEREHAHEFAAGYIAESPLKLRRRLLQYYAALHGQGDFFPNDCNAPWVSTVIEADGTVRPCFFQPPLGNIYQAQSLDAVLNSPEAVAWRRGLDTHRDAICRRCVCTLNLREDP